MLHLGPGLDSTSPHRAHSSQAHPVFSLLFHSRIPLAQWPPPLAGCLSPLPSSCSSMALDSISRCLFCLLCPLSPVMIKKQSARALIPTVATVVVHGCWKAPERTCASVAPAVSLSAPIITINFRNPRSTSSQALFFAFETSPRVLELVSFRLIPREARL